MREFNYERAWREHYEPAFKALPEASRKAFEAVVALAPDVAQDRQHLEVIVPANLGDEKTAQRLSQVKRLMRDIPFGKLAESAFVVYYYGHLAPMRHASQEHGAYWKFESLAKQVLVEAGLGEAVRLAGLQNDAVTKRFMDHKDGTDLDMDEVAEKYAPLVASEFEVIGVRAVNFKPHPFMIGTRHFPKDGGIHIDPRQAPCAMEGCNLGYDEHTHEVAMFVKARRNLTNKEAAAALTRVKDAVAADKVRLDGFAFVEGDYSIEGVKK